MTALLLALALLAPGKPYKGTVGTGATYPAAPSFAINSVTSFQQTTTGATGPVTVTTIPAGSVVVGLATCAGAQTDTLTSANLTFTNRQRTANGGQSSVFTAVTGGSPLSSEVITLSCVAGSMYPGITIVVLTGANTSQLTTVGTNTGNSSSMTVSVTAGAVGSYILGAFYLFTTTSTAAPDANTTELLDQDNGAGDHPWHARRTNVTTATGATVIGGTWGATNTWSASAIEIRPQ